MYQQWADFLADMKCGGERERARFTVEIGTRYNVYEYGTFVETIAVTEENKALIERDLNDPENDVIDYERI